MSCDVSTTGGLLGDSLGNGQNAVQGASSHSRFIDLPSEIRNTIYRIALVRSRPLWIVSEFHPEEEGKSPFVPGGRTSYETGTYAGHCMTGNPRMRTTYTMSHHFHGNSYSHDLLGGFLWLNRQVRHEAASLFYGENTFRFDDMNAAIPFLRDQSMATMKYVRSLHINFSLLEKGTSEDDFFGSHESSPYCATPRDVTKICSDLGQFQHLRLDRLCIILDDVFEDFLVTPFKYFDENGRYNNRYLNAQDRIRRLFNDGQWVWALSRSITDLNELGIAFVRPYLYKSEGFGNTPAHWMKEYHIRCCRMEKIYWDFLAPRMLKKMTDRHDPDSLQNRSIKSQIMTGRTLENDDKDDDNDGNDDEDSDEDTGDEDSEEGEEGAEEEPENPQAGQEIEVPLDNSTDSASEGS